MARRSHMACRDSLGFSAIVYSSTCSRSLSSLSVPDAVRRGRDTYTPGDVDARHMNLIRVQCPCRDNVVFHFDNGDTGGHRHDGVEIALRQPELQIAERVRLPGSDECIVSMQGVF